MTTVARGPWEGLTIAGGRYCDLTTLGEGGMGYVYRALDQNLRVPVVIKTPRRALVDDPDQIRRFEQEVGAMIQLSFPHIVPVIDVGRQDGLPFAVMRYLSGGSLDARVPRDAGGRRLPVTTESLATWLPSIAGALDFVHARGYLHRDVKPPNILFDQHQQAYLSDFGVIKVLGEATADPARRLTGDGFVVGTVEYMAPELLTDQPFDGRADQYALAVTVYELLCGRMPFAGNTPAVVMVQHLNQAAQPLSGCIARLPAAVSDAVARAMAKDPRQRFDSCTALAEAVLGAATAVSSSAQAGTAAWKPSATAGRPLAQPQGHPNQPTRVTMSAPTKPAAVRTAAAGPAAAGPASTGPVTLTPVASAPVSTGPAPTGAGLVLPPARPVGPASHPARRVWPLAAGAGVGVLLLAAGCFLFFNASAGSGEAEGDSPLPANSLPKQMAHWKQAADKVERGLWVDSGPLLAKPHYANSADLIAALDATAGKTTASTDQQLAALEHDLVAMAELQNRTAKQFEQYRQQHPAAGAPEESREQFESQKRELDDSGSQLLAFARRLQSLQQALKAPQGRFDAGATAELTMLREMEAAVVADHPVTVAAKTLDRAEQFAAASNPGLAWLATNVLARSDRPQGARQAIQWLGTYPPDRQAVLCWSLLLSGQSESIAGAVAHFQSHPELLAKLARTPLTKLVVGDWALYQPVLPLLLDSCATGDERFELFRQQAPHMTDAWASEIETSCSTGLLSDRVEQVVLEILAGQYEAAYPLAGRLLDRQPGLRLAALPPAKLTALLTENPELAGKLAALWIVRGNEAQRAAALAAYCDPSSKLSPDQLQLRLETDRPLGPTLLLNQALASHQVKAIGLAAFLLSHVRPLEPTKVNYAAASAEALARPDVRTELFKLGWQASEQGQAWVLEQMLGAEFVRRLQAADATRERQLQLLEPVVKTLDGKIVSLKNLGASASHDRGLQLTAREIAHLPGNVDPAPWAPEQSSQAELVKLQRELEPVRASADKLYSAALDQVDRYLSELVSLNTLAFELTSIYDVTISKQLGGARRQIQLKHLEAWDFRFLGASHQNFERQRAAYRELTKSLASTRQSLAIVQQKTAQ